MASREFRRMLEGYGLTTANIFYRLPDHPAIMQSYIWQDYDLQPEFPQLRKFLDFWQRSLDGRLHSVQVAHSGLIRPAEISLVDKEFRFH
ncbi:usg protein [Methylosinus sp. LW4]|uniref:usg protein n=1 Tax=Methylosinus sp. LW4 TaxID=136993 RepID=UPI000380D63B|nr:usg protein [Methylosinus sp. LW4]